MTARISQSRFTGYHMAVIMVSFFGVVIAVNLTMAWFAVSSWSGLVAEDTYVASQQFNSRAAAMRAMAATGIHGEVTLAPQLISYTLKQRDGSPAIADSVTAHFKRPVGDHQDFQVELLKASEGNFTLAHVVPVGDWIVEVTSTRNNEIIMHEASRIYMPGESQ